MLDTHLLLWAAHGQPGEPSIQGLSTAAVSMLEERSNLLHFSAASIWEVAIKSALERKDFKADPHLLRRGLVDNGYVELPVKAKHAEAVSRLPALHKDPFDRMLIAQATVEGVVLLTSDAVVASYPGPIWRV